MPLLPADFTHARPCKPFCEKFLTLPQDELAVMDGGKCILQLRGVRPFLSDKYDITQHPNYKYTADADPKNAFDIEGYLKARLKLKPNQVCDVYEIDAAANE